MSSATPTAAAPFPCQILDYPSNLRAVDQMVGALSSRGFRRLVVVGGNPTTRRELVEAIDGRISLRLVDGTERRTKKRAEQDRVWADLVVIWGGTELAHRVSNLYPRPRLVVQRRGVASLADEVTRQLDRFDLGRGTAGARA